AARAAALASDQELAVVGAESRPPDVTGVGAVTQTVVGLRAPDPDEAEGPGGLPGIAWPGRPRPRGRPGGWGGEARRRPRAAKARAEWCRRRRRGYRPRRSARMCRSSGASSPATRRRRATG